MSARFVVVATKELDIRVFGIYRTFKRAEGDAKASDGQRGYSTCVVPMELPDQLP